MLLPFFRVSLCFLSLIFKKEKNSCWSWLCWFWLVAVVVLLFPGVERAKMRTENAMRWGWDEPVGFLFLRPFCVFSRWISFVCFSPILTFGGDKIGRCGTRILRIPWRVPLCKLTQDKIPLFRIPYKQLKSFYKKELTVRFTLPLYSSCFISWIVFLCNKFYGFCLVFLKKKYTKKYIIFKKKNWS